MPIKYQMDKPDTLFPWVGNKKFYIDFIKRHLPPDWNGKESKYVDPFLGSAVVFQELAPSKAILSDKSKYLIDVYRCMQKNPKLLLSKVTTFYKDNSAELHGEIKGTICNTKSTFTRSAMFWYLLRTSLYSFVCPKADNKSFTCCYKSTGKPLEVKERLYRKLVNALQKDDVQLFNSDFAEVIDRAGKGDFLFIDPPYMNEKRPSRKIYGDFGRQDHERLVEKILEARKRGCYIMMFNHDHPFLLQKLTDFYTIPVEHANLRKSRSQFATYKEVLFTNYRISDNCATN